MSQLFIEKDCCVTHEGKKYCSGGSIITDNRLIAYSGKDEETKKPILTTWHGDKLTDLTYGGRHSFGYTYVYFRLNDKNWIGRESSFGNGSIVWAKTIKGDS